MNYMKITDPAQLHAAVESAMHEDPFAFAVADATVDAAAKAKAYAPFNGNLLDNAWVAETVGYLTTGDDDLIGLPDFGEVAVISAGSLALDADLTARETHRSAEPLRGDGCPSFGTYGLCQRCDLGSGLVMRLFGTVPTMKPLCAFQIARGQFVIEFAVCDDCFGDLVRSCGHIVQVVPRGAV